MKTAAEFQEQLEWFWLFCQEEAWSESMSTFSVIVTEYYQPSTGDRPYQSDRVVATMLTEVDAKLLAAEYNTNASGNQYYSIRKVE